MILFPNAKINLGLNVTEKRPDGFHNLQTVFYPIGLSDVLEIIIDKDNKHNGVDFQTSGIEIPGSADNNLCIKAYNLIKQDYPLPVLKVFLQKIIPIGAGLGGGSSDGAFFIKGINELLELNLSWGEMHHYAKMLGSDCSFFIINRVSYAEGRGDQLEPIDISLKGYFVILVKPDIHIGTAEAYAGVKPSMPTDSLENIILNTPLENWSGLIKNDFEESIFPKYPEIKSIKEKLYKMGATYASMSGSGSSVYGIFKNEVETKGMFGGHFVWQGFLD